MAFFWYNPFYGENISSQFVKYLQARSFVYDLRESIGNSAAVATGIVVGSLEKGLERIERQSAEFKTAFDWRLSLIADQQKVANMLMKNIGLLLQVPDSEKQRLHFLEQGLRYYSSAIRDPNLYADALDYFQKAESLKKQDFFVLYRLGLIHLQASDSRFLDFPKAEQYFRQAAKYSRAELDPHVAMMDSEIRKGIEENGDVGSDLVAHNICADSLRLAAMSCYLQEKFDDAATLADEAAQPRLLSSGVAWASTCLEAKYLKAKSLFALKQIRKLPTILESLFLEAPLYAVRAALDFSHDSTVMEFLGNFRDTRTHECFQSLKRCDTYVRPGTAEDRNLRGIEKLLAENTLLAALTAEPHLEGIWVRLVHEQRDRLMKAARAFRDANRKLKRCEKKLKRFQMLAVRREDEEAVQRRKWFFKDKTEIHRLETLMKEIAPDGVTAIEAKRECLENRFQKAFLLLAEERKQSLDMQIAFSKQGEGHFSEDFITMCSDLIDESSTVSQKSFQESLGLTPGECSVLFSEFEQRGFIAPGEKGKPQTVTANLTQAALYWSGIGVRMPRRRDRL